jgi:hypothetical protein
MLEEEEPTDLPWWTEEEKEQRAKDLHFLKQPTIIDQKQGNIWRDINWMYFKHAVLDKYRNNEFCDIVDQERISFSGYDKNLESTARFYSRTVRPYMGCGLLFCRCKHMTTFTFHRRKGLTGSSMKYQKAKYNFSNFLLFFSTNKD